MRIRRAGPEDAAAAAELALRLWPENARQELERELEQLLRDPECAVFMGEVAGRPVAFAQVQLRHDYVEGAETCPVGYLEGIYVREECRGSGAAAALLQSCENWAAERGCREFASDCELENRGSIAFHAKMGFREANRIVCFVKALYRQ